MRADVFDQNHQPVCESMEPRLLLSTSWQTESVTTGDEAGTYTSIAMDANDRPVISYYKASTQDLMLTRWLVTQEWSTPETVAGADDVGKFSSLAIDSAGDPHIAYYDATNQDLMYVAWDGAAWSAPMAVAEAGNVGQYASLVLDSGDSPHILYYDATNEQVVYTYWTGADWSAPSTVATVGAVSEAQEVHRVASMDLDGDDIPQVSFYDAATKDLMYTVWDDGGGQWETPVAVVETVGFDDAGADNSIVVDADGLPHISYFEYRTTGLRPTGAINYAHFDGSDWSTQVVEEPGMGSGIVSIGKYNSIALDPSGAPGISYYHVNDRELHFARWNGADWVVSTVDDEDSVGPHSDVVFDSGGQAHISYAKTLASDPQLKYAQASQADLAVMVDYPGELGLIPGETITIPVVVTNVGNDAISGSATLRLFTSTNNQAGDGDDVIASTQNITVRLSAGSSKTYNFRYQIPADTAPQTIYFVGNLVDGADLAEDVMDNNTDISDHSALVEWRFGMVEGKRKVLTLTGPGSVAVKFSLTGGGWGEVTGTPDAFVVTGYETTARSSLKLATTRRAVSSVHTIDVQGPLNKLDARYIDLQDDLTVQEGIASLRMHDLLGGNAVTLNSTDTDLDARLKVSLTFARTDGEVDLVSNKLPIRSLTADGWGNDANSLTAPSMAKFFVRAGDASGEFTLTGDANKYVLGTTRIKGNMVDALWSLTGDANSFRVYGAGEDAVINGTGMVRTLSAYSWTGTSSVNVDSIGSLKISGNTRTGDEGDFGAGLTLAGQNVAAGKRTLNSAKVVGEVAASTWTITGDAGTVNIGEANGWTLTLNSSLRTLKTGMLQNTTIDIDDQLGSLQALDWNGGELTADSAGTVKIKGDARNGVSGDLTDVNVTISGQNVQAGQQVLRSLYVKGQLHGNKMVVNGNAGTVDVACFNGSSLRMGIINLTGELTDFDHQYRLNSVKIRSLDDAGTMYWFEDSSELGVYEIGSLWIGGNPVGMDGIVEFFEIYRSNYEHDPAGPNPDLTVYDLLP